MGQLHQGQPLDQLLLLLLLYLLLLLMPFLLLLVLPQGPAPLQPQEPAPPLDLPKLVAEGSAC